MVTKESGASGSSDDLGGSTLVVSAGTLLSRIFGLLRDMSIAFVFGATRVTDVFFLAYQIPSTFRKLLAEGALSSSVIPVYTDVRNNRGDRQARDLGNAVFTWTILLVGLLVVLGILLADLLVFFFAMGLWETEFFGLTVDLTRVMFPFLLMMSSAAVVMGVLHARKDFAAPAFAPVCLNLSLIGAALWLAPKLGDDPRQQVWGLAVGVLVGGFFQFFVQWWWLRRQGWTLKWNPNWTVPGLRRILSMMGPMAFGLAVSQLIVVTDKAIASFLDPGNISHLYYSNRLFQFPFALIGVAVGTVVLPASSEHVSRNDLDRVESTTRSSLGLMSFLMVPSMVGLWMVGSPLIEVLFRSPEFDPVDQRITFMVLVMALLGLVAYGCIRIFVSICYSFEDTMGPVWATSAALVTNLVLGIGFVVAWPGPMEYRVAGLALAGSIAVWIQTVMLRRRLGRHLSDRSLVPVRAFLRHLVMAGLMGLIVGPLLWLDWPSLVHVVVVSTLGAAVYFMLAYLWSDPHLSRAWAQVRERLDE